MRKINSIIIHHSASLETTTVDQIRTWHLKRGFADIGYHWVLRFNGRIWECVPGRPESEAGAHCKNHNAHSIGVVVCGDYRTKAPCEAAQLLLKVELLAIMKRHGLTHECIKVHSDFGATECPGEQLRNAIDGMWPKGKAPDC